MDPPRAKKAALALVILTSLSLVAGCSEVRFYQQSVYGHLNILYRAQPIEEVINNTALDSETRQKLALINRVRDFATDTLKLEFNASYTHYIDLQREHVVTNLVAAPEFSNSMHSWCYPVIGCANYRGYFDVEQLEAEKQRLEAKGLDTYAYPVIAYSTLGWFSDPVLNTFLALPETRMVGLIFHELAHQHIYIAGDTAFNESFATAVERAGLALFYADEHRLTKLRQDWETTDNINAIAKHTRAQLDELYKQEIHPDQKRTKKANIMGHFGKEYARLTGADPAPLFNNARLGIMATYSTAVPAFLNWLQHSNDDFEAFLQKVKELGDQPKEQRDAHLQYWNSHGMEKRE